MTHVDSISVDVSKGTVMLEIWKWLSRDPISKYEPIYVEALKRKMKLNVAGGFYDTSVMKGMAVVTIGFSEMVQLWDDLRKEET